MKFDLTKPCGGKCNCPFRTDSLKGWLGRERAEEIADHLMYEDGTFSCHKTTDIDEEGETRNTVGTQHCAGAMILLEKEGRANQLMRISERLGGYDRNKLDMASPVFDTVEEFIEHHTKD